MPDLSSKQVMSSGWGRKIGAAAAALLMMVAYSLAMVTGSAGAAGPLPAPTNLAPNGITAGPDPVLTWTPVPGAAYYRVTHPDQNNNAQTDTVYAASFSTLVNYPLGTVNWSVTAYDGSNNPGTAANASFTNTASGGPSLSCPASPVNFPSQSPAFSWTSVPGASVYTLSVSTTQTFVPASTQTFHTQSTSYTLTTGVPDNQTYYAKVSGTSFNGVNTPTSATCSYQVVWSPGATGLNDATPTLRSPADGSTIRDVILRWDPLPGSASYEVQVSPNGDWTNNLYYDIITDATTWSPAKTLNNGSYYWRVRGIDNAGNFSRWSDYPSTSAGDAWEFNVSPLATPVVVSPAADSTISNYALNFSWKPVAGAAAYELQWSSNSSFSYQNQGDEINHTCITNHTDWSPYTYVNPPGQSPGPGGYGACVANTRFQSPNFVDGTTVYWHVRALDLYTSFEVASPWNTNTFDTTNHLPATNQAFVSGWSSPQRFFFNSDVPAVTGPAANASVATPTMSWTRVSGASYYVVNYGLRYWGWDGTNKVCTAPTGTANYLVSRTSALSYTPSLVNYPRLTDPNNPQCPIDVSFSVQAVDYSGRTSPLPLARTFTWSGYSTGGTTGSTITLGASSTDAGNGQPVNPANGASIQGIPRFTWSPVAGADHYQAWWYDNPSGSVYTPMQDYSLGSNQMDPITEAFTPTQPLPVETGAWQIVALDSSNNVIAASQKRTITINPPGSTTLTSFSTRNAAGAVVSCKNGCTTPSTPLISWNNDPTVDSYIVYIAQDPGFTNIVRKYVTQQNSIRPVEALPDNQAGQSYYVAIQPAIDNWRTGGSNITGTIYGDYGSAINPSNVWSFHKQSAAVTGTKVLAPTSSVSATSTSICDDGGAGVTTFSDMPTFCWNASSTQPYASGDLGAMSYHIQVSTTADFSNIIDEAWVDQPSYTPYAWGNGYNGGYYPASKGAPNWQPTHKTYPDGPIYWRVQAVDATGNGLTYSAIGSTMKASNAVTLNAPANAANVGSTPSLGWNSKTFAARYEVQVARNGDTNFSNSNLAFDQYTDLTSITPTNNNVLDWGYSLPQGTYAWRVRGVDANGNSGAWSSVRTFAVSPTVPSLTSPANSSTFTALSSLTFTWAKVTGAVRYRFFLSQSNPPTSGGAIVDTVSNAWSLNWNLANGNWFWQVQTLDSQSQVLATSSVRSFTYDGTRPYVSGLQAASTSSKSITLSWSLTPNSILPISQVVIKRFDSSNATSPSATQTVTGAPTSFTWAGLTPGTQYWFSVTPYDANGAGSESNWVSNVTLPGNSNDQSFVYAVYADFLGATPNSGQLASGVAAVQGGGQVARQNWVLAFAQSPTWINAIVNGFYQNTLGRPADQGGLNYWRSNILSGQYTVAQVAANFYSSNEYFNGFGHGTNTGWVSDLYTKLLGRPASGDPAGVAYWVSQIATKGRTWVAFQFYQSHESCVFRVTTLYNQILHRAPDAGGLDYWAGRVETDGDIALASYLASSNEYYTAAHVRFP